MKKILPLIILVLTGCATTGTKEKETQSIDAVVMDDAKDIKITLPESRDKGLTRSPFLNTQKSEIFNQQGFKILFYYGIGGRYLVQVILPEIISLDFSKGEGTLLIDYNGSYPETLSLDASREGIFQGQGNIRNGKTDFKLELSIPAPNGAFFKKELEFSVQIFDNLSLTE